MYVTSPAEGAISGVYSARRSEVEVRRPEINRTLLSFESFSSQPTCKFCVLLKTWCWGFASSELDIFRDKVVVAPVWVS